MPALVSEARELPLGSHSLSLHASRREAAQRAASFVAGAPPGQAATYWVRDAREAEYYSQWLADVAPDHVGCVAILGGPQVEPSDGKLRPAEPVRAFVSEHPEGVTGAAETITHYWKPETVPDHLEYEAWFDRQPRAGSRFLCPYDLRQVPADDAPEVMRELGSHHSHVVVSGAQEPGARLLQLFVFATADEVPEPLKADLDRALREGWVEVDRASHELTLTRAGEQVVHDWSARAIIDG
jgi:hypothetical protein